MRIEIKEVASCKNGAFGNFMSRGRGSYLITISRKLNTTVAEYGATVLHELLHLWVTFLRVNGFKVSDRKEHRFIYEVEQAILWRAKKYLRRKKK